MLIPNNSLLLILQILQVPHLGIVNTITLVHVHVQWHGIGYDITDISNCNKCYVKHHKQRKESMMPLNRQWKYVGSDMLYYKEKIYLLVCNYLSKYPGSISPRNHISDITTP